MSLSKILFVRWVGIGFFVARILYSMSSEIYWVILFYSSLVPMFLLRRIHNFGPRNDKIPCEFPDKQGIRYREWFAVDSQIYQIKKRKHKIFEKQESMRTCFSFFVKS
jgi:hypothetical protein